MRAFAVPLNVRSSTIASPISGSSGICSTPGFSRTKWCGESMWVPACTVISTRLETKPLSSQRTMGVSLKYTSSGENGLVSHSSTVMDRSTIFMAVTALVLG